VFGRDRFLLKTVLFVSYIERGEFEIAVDAGWAVTECDRMSEYGKLLNFVPRGRTAPPRSAATGVEGRLAAFLAGESDGADLLHALYDHVLDEPIPPMMLALVRQ
jgi:hypothetical protein